jgi:hypothetical protein
MAVKLRFDKQVGRLKGLPFAWGLEEKLRFDEQVVGRIVGLQEKSLEQST